MVNRRKEITEEEAKKVIPHGCYCYEYRGDTYYRCPFWSLITRGSGNEAYEEGYCNYLEEGDEILLWDQCKICGLNDFSPEELEEMGRKIESYHNESGVR